MPQSPNQEVAAKPFRPAEWRLIVDEAPRSGAANMALDQAIAEAAARGEQAPTLRFYQWAPPAVSLGRHQAYSELDAARIAALGYDIVRRPTGGRAILHVDELTYSICAPASEERVQGTVMDAYLRLSRALLRGLNTVGLTAADKAPGHVRSGKNVSAACFEVPSAYEITVDGRKLIGSAQSRRAGYVLQHGSLPLRGDITRLIDVLALDESESTRLRELLGARATTLSSALRLADDAAASSFDAVSQQLRQGFADELQLTFRTAAPSAAEIQRCAELIRITYANSEWTTLR